MSTNIPQTERQKTREGPMTRCQIPNQKEKLSNQETDQEMEVEMEKKMQAGVVYW